MAKLDFLETSRRRLDEITNASFNEQIRPVALAVWKKHLSTNNPQWKYISAKPFYIKNKTGAAHVMAIIDKRLPNIGIVGYFACTNTGAGAEVLSQAVEWLKHSHGLRDVYGPINGTLPSDYRLNLSDSFSFPGEPVNPKWHIEAFDLAGFKVFNRYVSGLSKQYLTLMKLIVRKPKKGFEHMTVRPFDLDNQVRDFKIYHELRNAIFPFQSVYCPAISLEERIYNSSGKFDPCYTYFLVDKSHEVGFVMAYAFENKLIMKTIGILPEYRGKRLKGLLIKPIREQAKKEGLEACIYGMVRVGNKIHKTRGPGVRIFRKYITMHRSM
jgi:hypothetical protein